MTKAGKILNKKKVISGCCHPVMLVLLGLFVISPPSNVIAQDREDILGVPDASVLALVPGIIETPQQSGQWSLPIHSLEDASKTLILSPRSDAVDEAWIASLELPVAFRDVEALTVIDDRLARRTNQTLSLGGYWKGPRFLVTSAAATAASIDDRILAATDNPIIEDVEVPVGSDADTLGDPIVALAGEVVMLPENTLRTPGRATWIRDSELWMQHGEQLINQLSLEKFTDVFLTIELSNDLSFPAHPIALAAFISEARASDINIWVCIVDETAVLPGQGENLSRMIRAYMVYNNTVDARSRIHGIQLDISPETLTGYNLQPNRFIDEYFSRLERLKPVAGDLPVDVNISENLLKIMINRYDREAVMRLADSFSVYGYDQDYGDIVAQLDSMKDSAGDGLPAYRLVLDSALRPDGMVFGFEPAENGRLWLVRLQNMNILLLLASAQDNPNARIYRMNERRVARATSESYSGNLSALWQQIYNMESELSDRDAFLGVAVYGLIDF